MGSVNDKEMQQRLQAMKEKIAGKKQQDSGYAVNEYGEIVTPEKSLDDIVKDVFNIDSEGASFRKRVCKGRDLRMRVKLDDNEMTNGVIKRFKIHTDVTCEHCKGTGSENAEVLACSVCSGKGYVERIQQSSIFGNVKVHRECTACQGTGTKIEHPCKYCHGEGIVGGDKLIIVNFLAGIVEGKTYILPGKGAAGRRGGESGDLHIVAVKKRYGG